MDENTKLNIQVKYNNDLNYLSLPKLTGRQQDLFFAVLSQVKALKETNDAEKSKFINKIKSRFFDIEKRELVIPYIEFVKICRINDWGRKFSEVYIEIENFLKILLSYIISDSVGDRFYHFVAFERAEHDRFNQDIIITLQKNFYEMVVNYGLGYTQFELEEMLALNGKYTKSLYRLLKQYRTQGVAPLSPMPMEEFRRIMDIPKNYRQINIDNRILKPAIKELSERTLLEPNRVAFKNLKYTKIKGSGRGRGGNVEAIQFTFTPQESIPVEAIAKAIEIKESKVDYNEKQEERKSYLKLDKNDIDTKIDILNAKFKNEFLYSKELDSILQVKFFDYDENNVIQLHFLNLNDEEDEKTIKMNYREALLKLPIMIKQYEKLMKDFEASETSSDFKL